MTTGMPGHWGPGFFISETGPGAAEAGIMDPVCLIRLQRDPVTMATRHIKLLILGSGPLATARRLTPPAPT